MKKKLVEVNRFAKATGQWQSSKFSEKKFENFHNCQLVLEIVPRFSVEVECKSHKQSKTRTVSLNEKVMAVLNNHLNYDLSFRKLSSNNDPLMMKLNMREFIIPLVEYNFYTRPLLFVDVHLAVPVGREYNGYEKLLLPFDSHV